MESSNLDMRILQETELLPIPTAQVRLEELRQLQALQKMTDQRGSADFERLKGSLLPGHATKASKTKTGLGLLWQLQRKRQRTKRG